jgi:hypothetical protein
MNGQRNFYGMVSLKSGEICKERAFFEVNRGECLGPESNRHSLATEGF